MQQHKDNPYVQEVDTYGNIIRVFNESVDTQELVWHRDRRDREVTILESNGWRFQYDNQLPFELKPGSTLFIKKNSYHRIIKGDGDFVIKIKEY